MAGAHVSKGELLRSSAHDQGEGNGTRREKPGRGFYQTGWMSVFLSEVACVVAGKSSCTSILPFSILHSKDHLNRECFLWL